MAQWNRTILAVTAAESALAPLTLPREGLSTFRHFVKMSTRHLACRYPELLLNTLKSMTYEPTSLALPLPFDIPGSRPSGKETWTSARVQGEREPNDEAAINPSVVSNLTRTPSLDHVPGHPVCAVSRPLT